MKKLWFGFFASVLTSFLALSPAAMAQSIYRPPSEKERTARMEDFARGTSGASRKAKNAEARRYSGDIEFRTFDGTSNNLKHPSWGSAHIQLLRVAESEYTDSIAEPAGATRYSAREISNQVAAQVASNPNARRMTSMVWQWGQFLDHDLDLTEAHDPPEEFSIVVPVGDQYFDPYRTGVQTITLFRSVYDSDTGEKVAREQINEITAWIDGSNVYGSDEETANSLRTFSGGLMATSDGDLLPFDESGFFAAGDIRANEQNGLTAMHTLFVREHNRIARQIFRDNPNLSDQEIFMLVRRNVVAILQSITYNEFLPALLGENAITPYRGYNSAVNPGIMNEFSTAAYRVGHTMLNSELLRLDDQGNTIEAGNLALRDAFFNPQEIIDHGIEPLLKGLAFQQAEEIDNLIIDDVRNFLFGPPGSGGFDLAALNIQRGRDHGLCDYNAMRDDHGLEKVKEFGQICSDLGTQKALLSCCDGDINNIDAWVGMLAEDHVSGASVGITLQTILKKQFEALRDGDRFWYERVYSGRQLERIRSTRLSDVIRRNTDLRNVQSNVFFLPASKRTDRKKR